MAPNPTFTHEDYELLQREVLYKGIFSLARYTLTHRLYDGGWSKAIDREIFERRPAAAILPYDPHLDRVILIEQFRAGCVTTPGSPWLLEIPAGIRSENEACEDVATREAYEESGCKIQALTPICDIHVSPGGSNEYLSIFCGKVDARHINGIHGLKDEDEDIKVINLTRDEALKKIETGKLKTSPAIISLYWLELHREKLQALWKL